jgi:hypothetical protein
LSGGDVHTRVSQHVRERLADGPIKKAVLAAELRELLGRTTYETFKAGTGIREALIRAGLNVVAPDVESLALAPEAAPPAAAQPRLRALVEIRLAGSAPVPGAHIRQELLDAVGPEYYEQLLKGRRLLDFLREELQLDIKADNSGRFFLAGSPGTGR